MRWFVLWFTAGLLTVVYLFFSAPTAIAHQDYTAGSVTAMVHLEPDDSPQAGKPTPTWIHLERANEQTIRLADCTCNLAVYDSQKQPILSCLRQPLLDMIIRSAPLSPFLAQVTISWC
jgi:hypothetical protein